MKLANVSKGKLLSDNTLIPLNYMTIKKNTLDHHTSFKDFLLSNKFNRISLLLIILTLIIQFVVFKYFYPYASYIHDDSFGYLKAADSNSDIGTHMIGYSRFLRLVSAFTHTDWGLVTIQYIFIEFGALFLLYTIFYFYNIYKSLQIILLCFTVLNPLFLNLSNLVSSDGIFLALSCAWFASMLWIIKRPNTTLILLNSIILFMAFTIRYNALIYPFIAAVAFLFTPLSRIRKISAILLGPLLCFLFVLYTANKYKELTGIWQYSPFSGWQLANNGMYAYRYVDSADRNPVPEKFKALDNSIRAYFDSTRNVAKFWVEDVKAGTFYMWDENLPLMKFMKRKFGQDTGKVTLKRWASMGPLYSEYGIYIIKSYPKEFVQYFLLPNAQKYYAPPLEYLALYNDGSPVVSNIAKTWFKYESNFVEARGSVKVPMLDAYPILAGTMNLVFLCSLICYLILTGFRSQDGFHKAVVITSVLWLINAGFTIFSSAAALRYQVFPVFIVTVFSLLLIDWMVKLLHASRLGQENISPEVQGKISPL